MGAYKYTPRTYHNCKLIELIDGDTLDISIDLGFSIRHEIRVRVLNLDTPETYGKDATDESKAHSKRAVAVASQLLFKPFSVTTHVAEQTSDEKRDGFRRFLADITLQDGSSYALRMRDAGFQKKGSKYG